MDEVILEFLEAFPRVEIDLLASGRPVDLIEDNVDIALRVRLRMEAGASFVVRRLGLSRGILVASPDLLQGAAPVSTPGDLRFLPAITIRGDNGEWRLVDAEGNHHRISVSSRFASDEPATMLKAAERGLGVALLPEDVCDASVAKGSLVRVLPGISSASGIVYAMFSRETAKTPALRAFIDFLSLRFNELSLVRRQG